METCTKGTALLEDDGYFLQEGFQLTDATRDPQTVQVGPDVVDGGPGRVDVQKTAHQA